MRLRDPLMGIKMGQGHLLMHLVYFLIIQFVVLPGNEGKCLDTGCVANLSKNSKELWTGIMIKLKWGHLVSFLALSFSMATKFRG